MIYLFDFNRSRGRRNLKTLHHMNTCVYHRERSERVSVSGALLETVVVKGTRSDLIRCFTVVLMADKDLVCANKAN